MQKKANHLAAAVFSALMLTAAIGAPAVSAEHYNVYNYDCWGEAVPAQAGYAAQRAVSGQDLGCGAFNTPSDLFRDWEDRFYIADSGNNRIVVTDGDFSKATRIYDKLKTEDGETTLKDPEGIYVSQETQCMYIADTGNSRLLVCDLDGNVQMELKRPDSTLYENETFKPQKVVADKAGNIYMVLNNITNGAAMFNSDGEFQGYFGANSVDATAEVVANYFWNLFATDEMRANSSRNVAAGITSFDVDEEGFIYTVTQSSSSETDRVKKVNPAGYNLFTSLDVTFGDLDSVYDSTANENYTTQMVDIDIDDDGRINCLDLETGRVFQYDEDGNLLLQREIGGDGKNVCRANGRPLTVTQLRQIGGELLNIHGQHDGQQLLDEEQHGAYLDRFGRMEAPLAAYRSAYNAMAAIRDQIRSLQMNEAEKARRMDSLRFQIDELERAELVPGEEEELNARRELLRNGEKYIAALSGADYCLSGDDNGAGAVSAIREAEEALRGIRTLSDELGELYKRLESIRCEVYDLAETIRDKRAEFAFSPAELDAAEARTDQLYRLKKKYGATVEDMIAYLEQCRSELDAMETADDTLILLNGKLKKAEAVVRAAGAELTQKRKAAAQALEQRIQSELRDLDMNKVRFAIEFTEKEPAADGCDVIRFLMSANAGEDLRPIAKIASGGELARIMLALKNVLAEQESIATLVFDEVDTGVSGRAAQKVAEKLTQVARHKQVLCVTHLPQLAAMADTHFSVEKGESGGRTFTRVIQLDREARKAELARITGGSQVTPALLESAGELLDQADAYRKQHFV